MGKLLIINGSPRAPKSNSKIYSEYFNKCWGGEIDTYFVISRKHKEICMNIEQYEHILFVFPLYADALPAVLINFLKQFEKTTLPKTTKIHVIINCGFLEPEQNNVAIDMLRYFCGKNEFTYGMTLCIAAGEAIMSTPFAFMVRRKIKKFVSGINCGKKDILAVSMPLTKKMFLKASAQYWKKYGEKFNTSEEEMRSDKIEDM